MIQDFDAFQAATVVEKTSKTGLLSNKRVLAIRSGVLYYYSNIPKDFKNNDTEALQNMKQTPKCSIQVRFLETISQDSKKPSELTIKFRANHAIERQQFKMRTSLVPSQQLNLNSGKANDMVSWTFKFGTQQLARWWMISLQQLKSHYEKNNDDENLQRFLESFGQGKKPGTPHRQSDFKAVSSHNHNPTNFRRSEMPSLPKGLNSVVEQDESQIQEDQIARQVKMREDKMKRDMEEKFKKELQLRIAEQARQRQQLLKERETERQAQEAEKLRILQEKAEELKKAEAAILEKEMQLVKAREEEKKRRIEEEKLRKEQEQKDKQLKELRDRELREKRQQEMNANFKTPSKLPQQPPQPPQPPQQAPQIPNKSPPSSSPILSPTSAPKTLPQPIKPKTQSPIAQPKIVSRKSTQKSFQSSLNLGDSQGFKDRNYLEMLSQVFCQNVEERIQRQTQLMKFVTLFRNQARSLVKSIINEFEIPLARRNFTLVKNTYSTLRLQIEFAFCQTTTVGLNSKTQVIYDQTEYTKLRCKFEMADQANTKIINLLKKRQHFSLRIPLMFLMEYRGVRALVTLCDFSESTEALDEQSYNKELAALYTPSKAISFKPRPIQSKAHKLTVLTIADIHDVEKIGQLEFRSPITPQEFFDLNAGRDLSTTHLRKVRQSLRGEKAECLELIEFSRNVRKLYRAGQGELSQLQLCNLVLKRDPSLKNLYQGDMIQDFPNKGVVIQYLREVCGIDITLRESASTATIFSEDNIVQAAVPVVRTRGYGFSPLQVIELSQNFDKYLKQGKVRLASLGLAYQKAIYTLELEVDPYVLNQISMHLHNNEYQTCLNELVILRDNLAFTHTLRLRCFSILLHCYKLTSKHEAFLTTFRDAMDYVLFVFGLHSYMASLYRILGQYLKSRGTVDEAIIVYEQAVALTEKLGEKELTLDLYIDMNNIELETHGKAQAQQLLQFTLEELLPMEKKLRPDGKARLSQHLGKLYYLVGEKQLANQCLKTATEHYQLNIKKHIDDLQQCYMMQLHLARPQQQREIANKILELENTDALSELMCFYLARLLLKSPKDIAHRLVNMLKDLPTQQPSEKYVANLLRKTDKNNGLSEYINNIYYTSVKSEDLSESTAQEIKELVNVLGKGRISKLISSI